MRIIINGLLVRANKRPTPVMKNERGRIWKDLNMSIDGKKINAKFDTNYGQYIFFQLGKQWYAFKPHEALVKINRAIKAKSVPAYERV